jgi:aspartyl-tRNA(Asn)/glutamyl-tRNA(Gln) amidotransferase subunit A
MNQQANLPDSGWTQLTDNSRLRHEWAARVEELNNSINALIAFQPDATEAPPSGAGPLTGYPFVVKDNIAVADFGLTCGSNLLRDLHSPYTATAVAQLQQAGARVVGKANLDEFGMGSSGQHSVFGGVRNPWNPAMVSGGSSGGSAAAVASGMVPFALGSDTGGSVRQPASFCGVYGLKPTYGAVSRFGLVAYASSLDVIGVLADSVALARSVFAAMRGADDYDQSSMDPVPVDGGSAGASATPTIGIPRAALENLDPAVADALAECESRLREIGCKTVDVELSTLRHVAAAYYVIATAEASANLARFDGIRYGSRGARDAGAADALVLGARSAGFGQEVKSRILVGTYVLRAGFQEQYYQRAQRIRTLVRRDVDRALRQTELLLLPTYPVPPFPVGSGGLDEFVQKQADAFTSVANLSGLPALAIPALVRDGLPIGMQLMAPAFGESQLFSVAEQLERRWPLQRAPGAIELSKLPAVGS